MEFKPGKPAAIDQFGETTRRSNGCGCMGIGCLVVIIFMVLLCVGSYFTLMHTSLPLVFIKQALESDGNVRVDGLRGSISSGFQIDKLEFLSDIPEHPDLWSELRGIKFEFNGMFDMFRSQRLIIHEATVDGGTIYARFDESGDATDDDVPRIDWNRDGNALADEFNEEFEDFRDEMESGEWGDLREFRINLIGAKDIQIVDPENDERLVFNAVEFSDFLVLDGQVVSFGHVNIASDQLDLTSSESSVYPDEPFAWHLSGMIKSPMHQYIIGEIPFDIDLAMVHHDRLSMTASFCDNAVQLIEPWGQQLTLKLDDWSPGQFVDLTSKLVPTHWNATIVFESEPVTAEPVDNPVVDDESVDPADPVQEAGNPEEGEALTDQSEEDNPSADRQEADPNRTGIISVEPGGSFVLGETRFELDSGTWKSKPGDSSFPKLTAHGTWNQQPINATVSLHERFPLVFVQLESADMEPRDIWARLFFSESFDSVTAEQQSEIQRALVPPVAKPNPPEPVDF